MECTFEADVRDGSCYGLFFFMQKTAYEMRISDWSSDVCSSDLLGCYEKEWPRRWFELDHRYSRHCGDHRRHHHRCRQRQRHPDQPGLSRAPRYELVQRAPDDVRGPLFV